MLALIVGTLLAVGALAYVLFPLFLGATTMPARRTPTARGEGGGAAAAERAGDAPDDAVEAALLAYRARLRHCARCGPRSEPDAVYCSSCGTYLPGDCASCGAPVREAGAVFCSHCGRHVAV